jgi:hypothetical protein
MKNLFIIKFDAPCFAKRVPLWRTAALLLKIIWVGKLSLSFV